MQSLGTAAELAKQMLARQLIMTADPAAPKAGHCNINVSSGPWKIIKDASGGAAWQLPCAAWAHDS
jgi:hypothetical protein